MSKPAPEPVRDERVEGEAWLPRVGGRVTLLCPEGWASRNFPEVRVGTITELFDSGNFYVSVQPDLQMTYVEPDNYARYGAIYRGWKVKDGWPHERIVTKKK